MMTACLELLGRPIEARIAYVPDYTHTMLADQLCLAYTGKDSPRYAKRELATKKTRIIGKLKL